MYTKALNPTKGTHKDSVVMNFKPLEFSYLNLKMLLYLVENYNIYFKNLKNNIHFSHF